MKAVIDSDQHLFEYRGLWEEHIDPAVRGEAIRFADDAQGHVRVVWRDQVLAVADVQTPGETDAIGERRRRERAGLPPLARYDEILPRDYWEPAARAERLASLGIDEAVLFPNYGLGWERTLQRDLRALTANMTAWNRWCETVVAEGRGRLHPVAHLTLRDLDWLERELARLAAAGVRAAMIAPALVDGKPLSHPDLDRAWAAFVERGISPCFHVADQPKVFDEAWYTDRSELGVAAVDAVLIHVAGLPRLHRSHPERRPGAPSRPAHRNRRALRRLGAPLPHDARRRKPVRAPAERPRRRALAAAERLLPAPGARLFLRLRAAGPDPARARRSRPPHVLQRLSPLGGDAAAPRGLRGARQARRAPCGRPATLSRQRGVPAAERCMKEIPRFNHVALTVPGELLGAEGRSDLLRFHERVFGWTEMPTMTRDRELLVLRAWSNEQFVYLHASPEPMRAGATEHFGLSVAEVTELDAMYERAEKFRAEDGRVELLARETQDFQVVKLHSFYVRYRLPLMIEVQCFEWAPGFGPERTA